MRKVYQSTHMILMLMIILGASRLAFAQDWDDQFRKGNTLYQDGQYAEALDTYLTIQNAGYESGSLYYNMGNCYYKMGEIGRAILFYEKARLLMPSDQDLKANLELANLVVVDKISPRNEFILLRVTHWWTHMFSKQTLIWGTVLFYFIVSGLLAIAIITRKNILRLAALRLCVITTVFLIVAGLTLVGRFLQDRDCVEAVILAQQVDVLSAPSQQDGVQVFQLHEGTKVRIDQKSDRWVEIILADGKVGWVKTEVLEII